MRKSNAIVDRGCIQAGITLLETSLSFVMFCTIFMLGAGLWDYVDVTNGLAAITDRYAYENSRGVYFYDRAAGRYVMDLERLREAYVGTGSDSLSVKAYNELKQEIRSGSDARLKFEIAFTSVIIDPQTGIPQTVRPTDSGAVISLGQASVPGFLTDGNAANGEIDFDSAFQKYVARAGGALAVPTQSFGISGATTRYLPEVPLIAVRAIYDYDDSTFLQALGVLDEPFSWDIKVAALRGEVG